jgi:uncharacterized RDD family membrane protein YckC
MNKKQNIKNIKLDPNIASVGRRFMAFIVDLFYILLLYFGFNIVGKNIFEIDTKIFDYIIIVVCFSYLVIPTGMYGKTIGKWALKISVVNPEGNSIGIGTSFAREIGGKIFSSIPLLIGVIWMIQDKKNRTWYDIFFETLVIKDKAIERKK